MPKITKEFFQSGHSWKEFLEKDVKRNKEAFLTAYTRDGDAIKKDASLTKIQHVAPYWMIIAEDWCYDSVGFVPVVIRLAEKAGVECRIWPRDKNMDLMEQYATHGKYKIPIVIFFDKDFNEKGRWIERPHAAHELVKDLQNELHRKMQEAYNTGKYAGETIDEIKTALGLS